MHDKPTNAIRRSSKTDWFGGLIPYYGLIQVASIAIFIGCFYSIYQNMISIEQRSQELAFKLQTTEKKVDRLETEIDRLQSLEI